MELVKIDIKDGKGTITVAVEDFIQALRLIDFVKDMTRDAEDCDLTTAQDVIVFKNDSYIGYGNGK